MPKTAVILTMRIRNIEISAESYISWTLYTKKYAEKTLTKLRNWYKWLISLK